MSQKQSGSAHVIIIVALVIALITALGWIFWQNVQGKETESSTDSRQSSDAKDVDDKKPEAYVGERFTSAGGAFSLKVPNGWKLQSNNVDDGAFGMDYITTGPGIGQKMDYDSSKDPTVSQTQLGGWGGYAEYFTVQAVATWPEDGDAGIDFKSDNGMSGKKTESVTQPRPDEEIYPTTDSYYSYRYLFRADGKIVQAYFGVFEQSHDKYAKIVDDVVRSLEIN
jgi:hypothetical protein